MLQMLQMQAHVGSQPTVANESYTVLLRAMPSTRISAQVVWDPEVERVARLWHELFAAAAGLQIIQ